MNVESEVRQLRFEGYVEGNLDIEPSHYVIWDSSHLSIYNEEYRDFEFINGFTAFGSNGSNELLATNRRGEVFRVPAEGMGYKKAIKLASSIQELKKHMEKSF